MSTMCTQPKRNRFPMRGTRPGEALKVGMTSPDAGGRRWRGSSTPECPSCGPRSISPGGFDRCPPLGETHKSRSDEAGRSNLVTAFLSCRAAVNAMTAPARAGRIVNVAAAPGARMAGGRRHESLCGSTQGCCAAAYGDAWLRGESSQPRHLGQQHAVAHVDHGTRRPPARHAESRLFAWPRYEDGGLATIMFWQRR